MNLRRIGHLLRFNPMADFQRTSPPAGYIHLILYSPLLKIPGSEQEFYLEIPTSFIQMYYQSHLKFLVHLGWCILGTHGRLLDDNLQEVDMSGQLQERKAYYYDLGNTDDIFRYAVDLQVMEARSRCNSSQSSARDDSFRQSLLERDKNCIFTGVSPSRYAIGSHIIPHIKGDEWLQLIIANRPHDEAVPDMTSIDDIRNGMLCNHSIHAAFDSKDAFILKTPNAILETNDAAPRYQRPLPPNSNYPADTRYTFQLLEPQNESEIFDAHIVPNSDAAFSSPLILPPPSPLLLNYHFGATAVKHWGRNTEILLNHPGIRRPEVKARPERTKGVNHDKSARKSKNKGGDEQPRPVKTARSASAQDTDMEEANHEWDEDDVMLFFWGNSRAAKERHADEQQDREGYVENWRLSVSS